VTLAIPLAGMVPVTRPGLLDRILSSPRFRAWATAFPLTRPIARRRAAALFDLCAGFVYSQVLQACVSLGLFDLLAEGPQPVDVLARRMALPTDAALRLLEAACALKLAARRGAGYGLGRLGSAMVGEAGIAAMVAHHATLYADLADPVALLRGAAAPTGLQHYWAYAATDRPGQLGAAQTDAYTTLMGASQPMIAAEILASYDLSRHRCLLDVGGGDGSFIAAAAARHGGLRFQLFDLPPVADRARIRFEKAGIEGRAQAFPGDFSRDSLPPGADSAIVLRVLHDHDDAVVTRLLATLRATLPPGGTLLLAEPMAHTPGAEAMGGAYFGFYLLAMGQGRPRSAARFEEFLTQAGFISIRMHATRMPMLTRLMSARVPGV
jgi:demethylspheroidene O-methyltransferase